MVCRLSPLRWWWCVSLWFWCLCGREFNLHNFDYASVFVVKMTLELEPREEIWNGVGDAPLRESWANQSRKYFHLTLFNRICQNASACLSLILVADIKSAWPLCSRHSILHFFHFILCLLWLWYFTFHTLHETSYTSIWRFSRSANILRFRDSPQSVFCIYLSLPL